MPYIPAKMDAHATSPACGKVPAQAFSAQISGEYFACLSLYPSLNVCSRFERVSCVSSLPNPRVRALIWLQVERVCLERQQLLEASCEEVKQK